MKTLVLSTLFALFATPAAQAFDTLKAQIYEVEIPQTEEKGMVPVVKFSQTFLVSSCTASNVKLATIQSGATGNYVIGRPLLLPKVEPIEKLPELRPGDCSADLPQTTYTEFMVKGNPKTIKIEGHSLLGDVEITVELREIKSSVFLRGLGQ